MRISNTIRFAKLVEVPKPEKAEGVGPGFKFFKNGQELILYAKDETQYKEWKNALKRVCIFTNFHETYTVFKMIGKGSFSGVYLAEHKETKEQFAIKALVKERLAQQKKGKVT
jgi:serine/threonine protein kinase